MGCREPVGPFARHQPTAPLRVWADAPFPVRHMVRSLSAFTWRDKKVTFPAMRSATPSLGGVMRKVPLQSLWFCILPFRARSPVLQMTRQSLWACSRGAGGAGTMGLGEGGVRAPDITGSILPCHAGHSAFHWVPSRALQVSQWGPAPLPVVTSLVCHLDVDTLAATPRLSIPASELQGLALCICSVQSPVQKMPGLLLQSSKNDCSDPCEWILPVKSPRE